MLSSSVTFVFSHLFSKKIFEKSDSWLFFSTKLFIFPTDLRNDLFLHKSYKPFIAEKHFEKLSSTTSAKILPGKKTPAKNVLGEKVLVKDSFREKFHENFSFFGITSNKTNQLCKRKSVRMEINKTVQMKNDFFKSWLQLQRFFEKQNYLNYTKQICKNFTRNIIWEFKICNTCFCKFHSTKDPLLWQLFSHHFFHCWHNFSEQQVLIDILCSRIQLCVKFQHLDFQKV